MGGHDCIRHAFQAARPGWLNNRPAHMGVNRVIRQAPASIRHAPAPAILRTQTLAMLCIAMASCSHTPSATPTSMPEAPVSTSAASTLTPDTVSMHPHLSPEDVGRRFLRMVDSLTSFDALSESRILENMRLPITHSDPKIGGYMSAQIPDSSWRYSFSYRMDPAHARYTNATLEFSNDRDDGAAMTPVCRLDFDAYVMALEEAGFAEVQGSAEYQSPMPHPLLHPGTGEIIQHEERRHFRIPTYLYSRGDVGVVIRQRREADAPEASLHHGCVESISVGKGS